MVYKRFFKRFLDICISAVALPFVFVIVLIMAPVIYFTDRGPVFYNAPRIGKDGKLFKMYKFRSMYVNSPDIRLKDGSTYNSEEDPRVTPVGRFMRKTSIDELPQFLNIFLGQMSLIGPRPDTPDSLDTYPEEVRVFLTVRPGITGYSQAYFRNSVNAEIKMRNDAYYAINCTFFMDVKIFFKTIVSVLSRQNIYTEMAEEEAAVAAEALKNR